MFNPWWMTAGRPKVKAGLIFPLLCAAGVPEGFQLYSDADGHFIIGAGGNYNAKDTDGSQTKTATTNTSGLHSGAACSSVGTSGAGTQGYGCVANGDHSHTVNVRDHPESQTLKLIKYIGNPTSVLAANVMVMWADKTADPESLSQYYELEKYFRVGASQVTPIVDTSTDGSHIHCNQQPTAGSVVDRDGPHGAHSHVFTTPSVSFAHPHITLGFWTHPSEVFQTEKGIIGLWDGDVETIPAGWYLMNGQTIGNITLPDMRDKMCKCTTQENQGNVDETATGLIASGDEVFSWIHGGCGGENSPSGGSPSWHSSQNASHPHNFTLNDPSYLPPVFGMYYVMGL